MSHFANRRTLGGGGATDLADLTDVSDVDIPAKDDHLIFNGVEWVFAPSGTTFTFSIATFTDTSGATTVEIGIGVWKAIGAISFSATYNNGPATGGYVSLVGWVGNLTLTGISFQGPTVNTEAVSFPAVGLTRQFTLHATDGVDNSTASNTYYFYNRRYWGVDNKPDTYTEADIEALAGTDLANSRAKSFTVNAALGEYILYSYPSRLGAAIFTVGGFEGGFESPETVSVTNASGYTEDFYIYRSNNSGLGITTVVVS